MADTSPPAGQSDQAGKRRPKSAGSSGSGRPRSRRDATTGEPVERFRCYNCDPAYEFSSREPVCPQCSADGRKPREQPFIARLVTTHFDPPHPIIRGRGRHVMACTGKPWPPGTSVSGETTAVTCTSCRNTAAFTRTHLEQHPPDATEKARRRVEERVSKIGVDGHPDLDADLARVLCTVATGVRECHRLIGSIPHCWRDEAEYRRLAACVADAASAARAAYQAVDMRLRRAGGPNPVRDALKAVEAVRDVAPLDPDGTPGGVEAILPRLYDTWGQLYPQADGSECIERMLDQLARAAPAANNGAGEVKREELARTLKAVLAEELAPFRDSPGPPPPPPRVRCDPGDNSVYLDGKQIVTGLKPEHFQFVSAVATAFPEIIPFKKIKQGKTKGKNPTRIKIAVNNRVRGSLPASHLDFIVGEDGLGYRLNLPPKSCQE